MAIKINQALTSTSGLTIPSGSVISYETRFKPSSLQPVFILHWALNTDNAKTGKYMGETPVVFPLFYSPKLVKIDFINLDLIGVETLILNYINTVGGITLELLEQVDIIPNA